MQASDPARREHIRRWVRPDFERWLIGIGPRLVAQLRPRKLEAQRSKLRLERERFVLDLPLVRHIERVPAP